MEIRKYISAITAAIFLAVALPMAAHAQDPASASPASRPFRGSLPGGIEIGATVSLLPFPLLSSESYQTTTSSPASQTVVASDATSAPAGGGVTVEIPLYGRIALQTGFLFRGVSYTSGTEAMFGEDDDATEADDRAFTSSVERTRAQYWDFPVILRFYDSADRAKQFRAFFQTGAAIRRIANIETDREQTAADGGVTSDRTPMSPINRTVYGGVIGAGMRFAHGGRLAFVPELRYTRWLAPTIESGPTRSSKNQLELLLSLSF